MDKQDFDSAITDFTEVIKLAPKEFKSYGLVSRGNAYWLKKDYGAAISDFTSAIELNPKEATFYYQRGQAHRGNGDQAKADADFEKAKQLGLGQ